MYGYFQNELEVEAVIELAAELWEVETDELDPMEIIDELGMELIMDEEEGNYIAICDNGDDEEDVCYGEDMDPEIAVYKCLIDMSWEVEYEDDEEE